MGIKFNCYACSKKLNVKAFLAGKRGICPHCGAKVDIPGGESESPVATAAPQSVAGAQAFPAAAPTANGAQTNGAMAVPVGPAATVSAAPAAATPAPASPVTSSPAPTTPAASPTPAPATAVPAQPAQPAAPVQPTQPAAPVDPIDESPQSVWYVRPNSGGQFGPASGEIMRRWLAEGRVGNDSLVWREGWADWQAANIVFPQLGGSTPPPPGVAAGPAAATPTVPVQTGNTPPGRSYPRKKNNGMLPMILVGVLAFAAIGLIILFLLVVSGALQPISAN